MAFGPASISGTRHHYSWLRHARASLGPRRLLLLITAVLVFLAPGLGTLAQGATPSAMPDLDGLPELRVRVTDDALEMSAETTAGRYMLVLENASSGLAGAYPMVRPEGVSAAEMQADIQKAIATPDGRVPDWFYETTAVGGPFAPPGAESRVVVNLPAGSYGVLNSGTGMVAALEVRAGGAATPTMPAELTADLIIEMREYGYVGLPEQVTPGPQVWSVTTTGGQPHELAVLQAPDGTNFDDVLAVLAVPPDATPAPGGLSFMDLVPVGGVGYLSPGQTAWGIVDLAPGTYVALCFVPDRETGMPHAAMGMITVFTVGDNETTATDTPAG